MGDALTSSPSCTTGQAARMTIPLSQSPPYRLNPYTDYDPLLRPLWEASRAHMGMITPCRLWTETKPKADGYAMRKIGGKKFSVHRLAWEEAYGPIPVGLCVCHFCDTRLCVNPAHLFLGTKADNNTDRRAKGRDGDHRGEKNGAYGKNLTAGEKNGQHKLTWGDIPYIRLLFAAGASRRSVAKRYGVSHTVVRRIVHEKTWCTSSEDRRALEEFWQAMVCSS
jgi:hypothetical protein